MEALELLRLTPRRDGRGGMDPSARYRGGNVLVGPAAFAKRLNAEIDAMPQNEFSLSHRERMQRLRLAEQDLFNLERSEELLIAQGEEDGVSVQRRFDADPAAILGVVIVRRGATTEAELIAQFGGQAQT
jgi:hypothetical protein